MRSTLFVFVTLLFSFLHLQKGIAQKWNGWILQPEPEVLLNTHVEALQTTQANMAVLTPVALTSNLIPRVEWNTDWQPVGERDSGVIAAALSAKAAGLRCAIMPRLSLEGSGSVANLELLGPNDWKVWWSDYSSFVLHFAHLADSMKVDCFVIGYELSSTVIPLHEQWSQLIDSIRGFYDGQLTYAAPSDTYSEVPFWSELDLIGINAHYRCDSSKTPNAEVLEPCLLAQRDALESFSKELGKPVLFTTFGFRSIHHTAWESSAMPAAEDQMFLHTNPLGQVHAFRSFFKVFWKEEWVRGGWIYKWEPRLPEFAHSGNGYTPQGKPALEVIKAWFEAFK